MVVLFYAINFAFSFHANFCAIDFNEISIFILI